MNLAAIDIGSNAARLLLSSANAYTSGAIDFTKLNLVRVPLRLGFDVFSEGKINEGREQKLIETMQAFKILMDIYDVEHYRACATSAMRDAKNGAEIIEKIADKTGVEIEIIDGHEEATILIETHFADRLNENKSYLYVDVGGGSTEITLYSKGQIVFKESFNIGTIRLLQNQISKEAWAHMKWFIKTNTKYYSPVEIIGSGGNINKIFSLSKKKEGKALPLQLLKDYYNELSQNSVQERIHIYGLREDRADVIVPALQIYISVMRWAMAEEIYVPKIGLTDGLIRMLYKTVS